MAFIFIETRRLIIDEINNSGEFGRFVFTIRSDRKSAGILDLLIFAMEKHFSSWFSKKW